MPGSKNQAQVYSVNDISFHPVQGTFSSCGSDGVINFWDGNARMRLKCAYLRGSCSAFPDLLLSLAFDPAPGPISCSAFNASGTIFVYAVSYDWYKGFQGMTSGHPNKVMLHGLIGREEEVKRRVTARR